MYKVFVNNKPIILTTKVEKETNFKNYLLKTVHIGKVIKDLKNTKLQSARLIDFDKNKLIKNFLKLLPTTIAGGGKVYNENGKVLFIYRNDKWDLPKGGTKRNETIDQTALVHRHADSNCRRIFETVGFYTPKTIAAGIQAKPQGC